MSDLLAVNDAQWRAAVEEALRRTGELIALLAYSHRGGRKDWFLIHEQRELESVLGKVGVTGPVGVSDMISLLATPELPHRGTDLEHLREEALQIVPECYVILACKRKGDPELHDQIGTDERSEVDEWFEERHDGELIVGQDPYHEDRVAYPTGGDEFIAFGVRPDGTVKAGAY